jgi:hypothetical protein
MINAIKLIKANFKMTITEFVLGTVGFGLFMFLMILIITIGGGIV